MARRRDAMKDRWRLEAFNNHSDTDSRITMSRLPVGLLRVSFMSILNSIWQVEVDRATSAEWSQMLDLFDDANIYQTAAYGEVRWGERNLSRLVLKRDGEVAGMAQVRIIRPTPLKFGMAYLRCGPLWERRGRAIDPEVPARMARAIEDEYLRRRKLFVCILPNAFAGSSRAELFYSAFSKFTSDSHEPVNPYRTFVVDITPPVNELRSRLDAKWRNKLKQAERNDLTVISGQGRGEFRLFCDIYFQMRKRKTFETSVDVEEFEQMQEALPESERMQVLICKDKGTTVAGIVVSAIGDSAVYLLGATSDAGLNSRGAYLLQWTMMCRLKEKGVKWYDLGGIDPEGNPGVYYYKRGMSGADVSQIKSLTASVSTVSSGLVKASLGLQRMFRASLKSLNAARVLKQPAPTN